MVIFKMPERVHFVTDLPHKSMEKNTEEGFARAIG